MSNIEKRIKIWDENWCLTEEAKNKIAEIGQITELFEFWQEAQKMDEKYDEATVCTKGKKTLISKYISKESFTLDGIIDEDGWGNAKYKVLYILPEANGKLNYGKEYKGKPVKVDVENGSNTFWMKNQVRKTELDKCIGRGIGRRIEKIQKKIYEILGVAKVKETRRECLYEIAYMNINKRGGFNKLANAPKGIKNNFIDYARRYAQFIKREIEIINPQYIVYCGFVTQLGEDILNIFKLEKVKYISVPHPSARKSDKVFFEEVEKVVDNLKA